MIVSIVLEMHYQQWLNQILFFGVNMYSHKSCNLCLISSFIALLRRKFQMQLNLYKQYLCDNLSCIKLIIDYKTHNWEYQQMICTKSNIVVWNFNFSTLILFLFHYFQFLIRESGFNVSPLKLNYIPFQPKFISF